MEEPFALLLNINGLLSSHANNGQLQSYDVHRTSCAHYSNSKEKQNLGVSYSSLSNFNKALWSEISSHNINTAKLCHLVL